MQGGPRESYILSLNDFPNGNQAPYSVTEVNTWWAPGNATAFQWLLDCRGISTLLIHTLTLVDEGAITLPCQKVKGTTLNTGYNHCFPLSPRIRMINNLILWDSFGSTRQLQAFPSGQRIYVSGVTDSCWRAQEVTSDHSEGVRRKVIEWDYSMELRLSTSALR